MGEISDADKKLIDEASVEMETRLKAFFDQCGISPSARMAGLMAYKGWLERFARLNGGRTDFYKSPLAMKMFIVGYWESER